MFQTNFMNHVEEYNEYVSWNQWIMQINFKLMSAWRFSLWIQINVYQHKTWKIKHKYCDNHILQPVEIHGSVFYHEYIWLTAYQIIDSEYTILFHTAKKKKFVIW